MSAVIINTVRVTLLASMKPVSAASVAIRTGLSDEDVAAALARLVGEGQTQLVEIDGVPVGYMTVFALSASKRASRR